MAQEPAEQKEKVNNDNKPASSVQAEKPRPRRQPPQRTGGGGFTSQRTGGGGFTSQRTGGGGFTSQRTGGGGFNRGGQRQQGNRPYQQRRRRYHRRKVCLFCADKTKEINWKKIDNLRRFIGDNGSIFPRRKSGACAKHQRRIAVAIKRARHIALLPYTTEHIRIMGKS